MRSLPVPSARLSRFLFRSLIVTILTFMLVIQPVPIRKHHQEAEAAVITLSAAVLAGILAAATAGGMVGGYEKWAAKNLKLFPETEQERLEFTYDIVSGGCRALAVALGAVVLACAVVHFSVAAPLVLITVGGMIVSGITSVETLATLVEIGHALFTSVSDVLTPAISDYLAGRNFNTTPAQFIADLKSEVQTVFASANFQANVMPVMEDFIDECQGTLERASVMAEMTITDANGNIPASWTVDDVFRINSTLNCSLMGDFPAGTVMTTDLSWYVYNYGTGSWAYLTGSNYSNTGTTWYTSRTFTSGTVTGAELLAASGLSAGDPRPVIISVDWTLLTNSQLSSSGSYHEGVSDPTDPSRREHLLSIPIQETPALRVEPAGVIFSVDQGANPPSQQITIRSGTSEHLDFTINEAVSWLSLSAASGQTDASVTLNVDSDNLSAGTYNGTLTVNCASPPLTKYVNVTLLVKENLTPGTPTDDAYAGYPDSNSNYGDASYMYVGGHDLGSDQYFPAHGYVRFDVPRSDRTVTNAVLRLYCRQKVEGSGGTVTVRQLSGSWDEDTIRYDNRPTGYYLSRTNSVTGTGWEEWDVTSITQKWVDGTYANNGLWVYMPYTSGLLKFDTREGSNKPELIVEYFNDSQNPNLVVSAPTQSEVAAPPFQVGQTVTWKTTVANEGPGDAESTRVGFWLTDSPSVPARDPDNDEGTGLLVLSDSSTEEWTYTFRESDIGAGKYLVVKADWEGDESETDENDNVAVYGPFSVIAPPEFSIGTTSPSTNVEQGGAGTYSVRLSPEDGFTAPVTLSATGLPAGVTAAFGTTVLTPGTTTITTLTLSASESVAEGTYAFTLQGTGGGYTRTASLSCIVTAPVQVPTCPVTISPTTKYNTNLGRVFELTITALNDACTWEAVSSATWLGMRDRDDPSYAPFDRTYRGTGDAVLFVGISENEGDASRSATITVGDQVLTVYQAGLDCGYQLSFNSKTVGRHATSFDVDVEVWNDCEWGTTNWPNGANVDWITFSVNGGVGSGTVTVHVAENTGPARTGGVSIAGLALGVTQEGAPLTPPSTNLIPVYDLLLHDETAVADGKLVFISNAEDADGDVWTADIDASGNLTNLTNLTASLSGVCRDPQWSPDGTKIAFRCDYNIHTMDADGSNRRQLTTGTYNELFPAWSPDGTRIAFSRITGMSTCSAYYTTRIGIINADDGAGYTEISNTSGHGLYDPCWSPDGTKILYNRDEGTCSNPRDLYVMDADGTDRTLIYPASGDDWQYQWDQNWGAQGRILFRNGPSNSTDRLGIINPDGSGLATYAHPAHTAMQACTWAFGDTKVIYAARTATEGFQLYMIDKEFASPPVKLTNLGANFAFQAHFHQN